MGIEITSFDQSASVSAIGLRYTGGVFTTIPQLQISSTSVTPSTYHVFPQFADGILSDGSYYTTTRMYEDDSATESTTCLTQLRGLTSSGYDEFSGELDPETFIDASTAGTQKFQAGYASMDCSSAVDAQALYSYYNANGTKLSEATVFSSPSAKTVQVLIDTRENARLGLAIANDSDLTITYTITVIDANGFTTGSATQILAGRASIANFVDQWVTLPANYVGKVVISSSNGAASIIGLRYTGAAFTTIPETILGGPQ
jgi:hypothetical protein